MQVNYILFFFKCAWLYFGVANFVTFCTHTFTHFLIYGCLCASTGLLYFPTDEDNHSQVGCNWLAMLSLRWLSTRRLDSWIEGRGPCQYWGKICLGDLSWCHTLYNLIWYGVSNTWSAHSRIYVRLVVFKLLNLSITTNSRAI